MSQYLFNMKNLIRTILKEETQELDKGLLNFLKRRANIETKDLSFGEGKSLVIKTVSFYIDGDWTTINSFMSKKEMKWKLFQMLDDNNQIDSNEYDPSVLNTDRQKVVRTIKHFIDVVMNDK